jgi:hypothetical protein
LKERCDFVDMVAESVGIPDGYSQRFSHWFVWKRAVI